MYHSVLLFDIRTIENPTSIILIMKPSHNLLTLLLPKVKIYSYDIQQFCIFLFRKLVLTPSNLFQGSTARGLCNYVYVFGRRHRTSCHIVSTVPTYCILHLPLWRNLKQLSKVYYFLINHFINIKILVALISVATALVYTRSFCAFWERYEDDLWKAPVNLPY